MICGSSRCLTSSLVSGSFSGSAMTVSFISLCNVKNRAGKERQGQQNIGMEEKKLIFFFLLSGSKKKMKSLTQTAA